MNDNNFYSEYNGYDSQNDIKDGVISKTITHFIKAYLWMFVATLITFITGVILSKVFIDLLYNGNAGGMTLFLVVSIISFIGQFVLCITINKNALEKANFGKALGGLILFSLLNGVSFASLFAFFEIDILYQVFGIVALYFLLLTALSYVFRRKIHKASGFAYIGLITLLIVSGIVAIYSLLFYSPVNNISQSLYLGVSILGLIVFTILTLVDVKAMYTIIDHSENKKCASISAAFNLYLDFINIFIYILRIASHFIKKD